MEFVAFSLIVQHNNYQKTIFSRQTSSLFCYISSYLTDIQSYFRLNAVNQKLLEENTVLRNRIEQLKANVSPDLLDSTKVAGMYIFRKAKTINSNFNKTKNYITIDKGFADGIRKEMAVISADGVVGIIQNISNHYAVILPLINVNLRVSAKVKKNGYYGSFQWDGNSYRYSYLNDIPFHVDVQKGDTIVTSGFSSIFPEGELIGFVESVDKETANFLSIKVKLATDFKKISDVYVIENREKEEKRKLEAHTYEEK